jgi:hypothetical protein
MNEETRYVCENLRTGLNGLSTGADGYPSDITQEQQWRIVSGVCYGITREVCAGQADDEERAWYRAAQATLDLIASAKAGVRDPDVAAAWFAARADLPLMRPA